MLAATLACAACGGQTAPLTVTDLSGTPEAGSPECILASGACVLCNDGNWHCGDDTLPQCSYAPPREPCPSPGDYFACFTCENGGTGVEWNCQAMFGGGSPAWTKNTGPSCSP